MTTTLPATNTSSFGSTFKSEAKLFANTNLFMNPMIPQVQTQTRAKLQPENYEPLQGSVKLQLDSQSGNPFAEKSSLVQVNPLDSNEALKTAKRSLIAEDEEDKEETPIYKSLFDVPGNSKLRSKEKEQSSDSDSSSED